MDSSPKTSRIPKFGSGLRKALFRGNGSSKSSSATSTPQTNGSTNLGRSKSMRVSRSMTPQNRIIKPSSSLDNDDADGEGDKEEEPVTVTSLKLPKPRVRAGSRSQPNSRPNSPYIDSSASNLTDSSGSSDSQKHQQLPEANLTRSEPPSYQRHARSKSFGAKGLIRPRSANNRARAGSIQNTSEPNSPGLVPRSSNGNNTRNQAETEETDGAKISIAYAGNLLRPQSTRRASGSRPSSMIITQEASDLNQLASELSRYEANNRPVCDGRSPGSRPRMTTHYSTNNTQAEPSRQTSDPSHSNFSSSYSASTLTARKEDKRPSSSNSFYHRSDSHPRPRSATDVRKVNPAVFSTPPQQHGSRSSTPSSERSTSPRSHLTQNGGTDNQGMRKGALTPGMTSRRTIPSGRGTRSVRVSRPPILRTPRSTMRVGDVRKVKTLQNGGVDTGSEDGDRNAVGLNELEGAVLMDAEEYRGMLQEVKSLKTMLLRLKRELTTDGIVVVNGTSPAAPAPATPAGSVAQLRRARADNKELLNKIQQLTAERNRALEELDRAKKTGRGQMGRIDQLTKDVVVSRQENEKLSDQLAELEIHREQLLDKVERLHADKHNLEGRLDTLEKSARYEMMILEEVMDDHDLDNDLYSDEDATY